MGAFGWPHLLIILAVILLLFGAAKLPALAKSVGQSARAFRGEMKAMKEEDAAAGASSSQASPAADTKGDAGPAAGTGESTEPKP